MPSSVILFPARFLHDLATCGSVGSLLVNARLTLIFLRGRDCSVLKGAYPKAKPRSVCLLLAFLYFTVKIFVCGHRVNFQVRAPEQLVLHAPPGGVFLDPLRFMLGPLLGDIRTQRVRFISL